MVYDNNKITTIRASRQTKEDLKEFGKMGESEEEVIKRLMFIAKNGEYAKRENESNKEVKRDFV